MLVLHCYLRHKIVHYIFGMREGIIKGCRKRPQLCPLLARFRMDDPALLIVPIPWCFIVESRVSELRFLPLENALQLQKWTELVTNKSRYEQELLTLSELEDSSIPRSSDVRYQKCTDFRIVSSISSIIFRSGLLCWQLRTRRVLNWCYLNYHFISDLVGDSSAHRLCFL